MADQVERHHLVWGAEKIRVLRNAHVVIAGVGGLGCVVAEQLVRAGIGALTLIDHGLIDVPDLGRQVLYSYDNIGQKKVDAAADRLNRLSPFIQIRTFYKTLSESDYFLPRYLREGGQPFPVAFADCLDNYAGRFTLERQIPDGAFLVHAGIEDERGQITTVLGGGPLQLRDIFTGAVSTPPPIPVIPQCCAIVGGYQSLVVLNNLWWEAGLVPEKYFYSTQRGRLTFLDMADGTIESVTLAV